MKWELAWPWVREHFDGKNGGWAVAQIETMNPAARERAALICAAPDLLAAVAALVDFYGEREGLDGSWDLLPPERQEEAVRLGMRALAKAGEVECV